MLRQAALGFATRVQSLHILDPGTCWQVGDSLAEACGFGSFSFMIYRFGEFELDTSRNSLEKRGQEIDLEPLIFSVLCVLLENRDRVVTKEVLVETVWKGRFVSDDAVSTAIKVLRRVLGDDGNRQEIVKTLRGRGYRFVAMVRMHALAEEMAEAKISGPAPRGQPSIAVLPFQMLERSDTHSAIADALPAELITALSRLRWLKVFARGSCFRFRSDDVDPVAIREALGARYCLSGVIEVLGRHLAISVELTDTRSCSVVWSDRIRGNLDDVHELRVAITSQVINAMELQIPMREAEIARLKPPLNLDAWSIYHIGLQHMYRFNKADNMVADHHLERAIELEPSFARAHAARSFTSFQSAFLNYTADRAIKVADARRFAERALELDPLDPFGNFTLGRSFWLEGHPENAMSWLDRAVEYSPNFSHGHYAQGWTLAMAGRGHEARREVDTAMKLSPLDPFIYAMRATRAFSHLIDGDVPRAARWAEWAARSPGAHYLIGMIAAASHHLNGDQTAASHCAKDVLAGRSDASTRQFFKAFPFSDAGLRREIEGALTKTGFSY